MPRRFSGRWWGLFVCVLAAGTPAEGGKRHKIGYRLAAIARAGDSPLVVAVWYPARAGSGGVTYRLPIGVMTSDASANVRPAKGPFPLVIWSHGGGGCATMGAAFAEALAEQGFVVAGPDHHDEFIGARSDRVVARESGHNRRWMAWANRISRGARVKYAHRPAEVRATIDYLLKATADRTSDFYRLVDGEKIGIMGVSFGAWTTQAVAGFIPRYCDERIKAAIPIAGNPGRRKTGFADVRIPLMLVFGENETTVFLDPDSSSKTEGMVRDFQTAHPPKVLVGIAAAKHLHFGGAGMSGRRLRSMRQPSSVAVRRNDPVIATVNRYSVAFFRRYLLDDRSAERVLGKQVPEVFLLKAELKHRAGTMPN